jgi:nitrogen regulatory protein PII
MKMLTIICREFLEDEVLVFLGSQRITGFTVLNDVGGSGESGKVSGTHGWKDRNKVFLIALDDDQIPSLVGAVKAWRVRLIEEHGHGKIPLRAFLQPCEPIA